MNERKEEKRVTSIARKINLQNVGSMLLAYLWVDIPVSYTHLTLPTT